jgi:hypothetical protein
LLGPTAQNRQLFFRANHQFKIATPGRAACRAACSSRRSHSGGSLATTSCLFFSDSGAWASHKATVAARAPYTLQKSAANKMSPGVDKETGLNPNPDARNPASIRIEAFENPGPDRQDAYLLLIDSVATSTHYSSGIPAVAVLIFLDMHVGRLLPERYNPETSCRSAGPGAGSCSHRRTLTRISMLTAKLCRPHPGADRASAGRRARQSGWWGGGGRHWQAERRATRNQTRRSRRRARTT